jgi:glycosyltransferase involved in cell wall biosynthesis
MISVILPTYNSIQFLEERVASILEQTLGNWECIVIDGHSKDGTYEYLQSLADNDKRFQVYQYPPKGPYDAWNKGIEHSKGEYIYIATSDDTMSSTLFTDMVAAFERHPECELAHCCLTVIDENGVVVDNQWNSWSKVVYFGDSINEEHVRNAPHDGLAHAAWSTLYSSVTQLLIKKTLLQKTGLFSVEYGSIADFQWGVKAGFVAHVVHVPQYLATWRKHKNQLTDDNYFNTSLFYESLIEMSESSLVFLKKNNVKTPPVRVFNAFYLFTLFSIYLRDRNILNALRLFLKIFPSYPVETTRLCWHRIAGKGTDLAYVRERGAYHVNQLISKYSRI